MLRLGWAFHRGLFRLSGGRMGTRRAGSGLGTLFLLSTGRRTGTPRRNGLFYIEDGPNLVVVASNAGEDNDPSWWRNLQATPEAIVSMGSRELQVRARAASRAEADHLWPRLEVANPDYAIYRRKTARSIPIIILEPR